MDSLGKQYYELSDTEKKALFVYKSGMSEVLNDLDNEELLRKKYDYYVKIFNNFKNYIIKMTYFNLIDMTTIDTFKRSLIYVKQIIDEVSTKLITTHDLKLFRMISSSSEITDISKGNIISVTTSPGEVIKYELGGIDASINKLDDLNLVIYEIELPMGSHVCCVPGRFKYNDKENILDISSRVNEEELILNKDIYDIDVIREYDNDGIKYIKCKAIDRLGKIRK